LDVSKSLKSLWDFLTSIGSFQGLLAEDLEVILLPQRLALKYNTTHRASCQHFSAAFFIFLFNSSFLSKENQPSARATQAGGLVFRSIFPYII